jgi:hypothetical protein
MKNLYIFISIYSLDKIHLYEKFTFFGTLRSLHLDEREITQHSYLYGGDNNCHIHEDTPD